MCPCTRHNTTLVKCILHVYLSFPENEIWLTFDLPPYVYMHSLCANTFIYVTYYGSGSIGPLTESHKVILEKHGLTFL